MRVDGTFAYRDGEIVTFAAGEIVLGSAEGRFEVVGMRLKYYQHVPYFMNEAILQSRQSPSYEA